MIGEYIHMAFNILQTFLLLYFGWTVLMLFIFSFASLFPYRYKYDPNGIKNRIALLIPAYMEDEVIKEVIKDALKHNYPSDKFDVILIADSFKPETLDSFAGMDIKIYARDFEISTKTRALNYALQNLDNDYDIACILDADNIMEDDFLLRVNDAYNRGFTAIQGHRTAKNLNTDFAILDAVSEEINNSIFRKSQRVLGLSSFLIGSAMAFDFQMFKSMMAEIEVVGGFDKELEMRLLSMRKKTEYLPDAIVLDEKVQNARVFTKQRRRWLSAQFNFFGKKFIPALKQFIIAGNFEYFFKATMYIQPPRILLLGFLFILTVTAFFLSSVFWFKTWLILFLLMIMVLIFSIPGKFYNFNTLKALFVLPRGFVLMMFSLLKIRKANEKFIHTKHTYNAFQIKRKKKQ